MSAALPCDAGFAVEPTPIGLQALVPGVAPINLAQRLAARAAAPLGPARPQRPCDSWPEIRSVRGTDLPDAPFDLAARNQLDLFPPKEP